MALQQDSERFPLPTDPAEFDSDERISFSKLDNKFIAVQDDGTELEFDNQLRRWVPILDEELLREQQKAYMVPGVEDTVEAAQNPRKRKKGATNGDEKRRAPAPKPNTAVYVTNLPFDATVDEVHELFSRKAGVIAEEIDSGRPRIKMYTDPATGAFKGEALVVFFKPESVDMAVMLLDDTPFRPDTPGSGVTAGRMRVMVADSSYKKTKYEPGSGSHGNDGTPAAETSQAQGSQHPKATERSAKEKQKIIKKTQKLAAKLADWSDDEDAAAESGMARKNAAKFEKIVVLRHMFTLEELAEDEDAFGEIRQDVLDECEKLGPVTKVTLYDLEPDGIVTVKFRTPLAARACVERMQGRSFAGRTIEASIATGPLRFRKTPDKKKDDESGSE